MNVAIIGAGRMGNVHAQVYAALPGVQITAVADIIDVACVRDNRPVEIAPPEESLEALKVIEAELQSAHEGRQVATC